MTLHETSRPIHRDIGPVYHSFPSQRPIHISTSHAHIPAARARTANTYSSTSYTPLDHSTYRQHGLCLRRSHFAQRYPDTQNLHSTATIPILWNGDAAARALQRAARHADFLLMSRVTQTTYQTRFLTQTDRTRPFTNTIISTSPPPTIFHNEHRQRDIRLGPHSDQSLSNLFPRRLFIILKKLRTLFIHSVYWQIMTASFFPVNRQGPIMIRSSHCVRIAQLHFVNDPKEFHHRQRELERPTRTHYDAPALPLSYVSPPSELKSYSRERSAPEEGPAYRRGFTIPAEV